MSFDLRYARPNCIPVPLRVLVLLTSVVVGVSVRDRVRMARVTFCETSRVFSSMVALASFVTRFTRAL